MNQSMTRLRVTIRAAPWLEPLTGEICATIRGFVEAGVCTPQDGVDLARDLLAAALKRGVSGRVSR